MYKLRLKLIKLLQAWLERLQAPLSQQEHESRRNQVKVFFHELLPTMDEKWAGKAIIEGGKFNYFELPNGDLPQYDFALPEIPLYVLVADIRSANWELARQRGISRDVWEKYQTDLKLIQEMTPQLATIGMAAMPQVIILNWDDPINAFILLDKIKGKVK